MNIQASPGERWLRRRIQWPANSDVFDSISSLSTFEYLDHFVERPDIGCPLVEFVPYVQFDYTQSFIASRLTTKPFG